jgi:hypothetical protein
MSEREIDEILGAEYTSLPQDKDKAFIVFENRVSKKYDIRNNPTNDEKRLYIQDIQSFLNEYQFNVDEVAFGDPGIISTNSSNFERFNIVITGFANSLKVRIAKERATGVIESVKILSENKQSIRDHIDTIKIIIDGIDLSGQKKDSLFGKLNTFLNELDKEVTRLTGVLSAMVEISSASGDIAEQAERTLPFFEKVLKLIGKSVDDTGLLPPWREQKKLEAPPKQIEDHSEDTVNDNGTD